MYAKADYFCHDIYFHYGGSRAVYFVQKGSPFACTRLSGRDVNRAQAIG